jgi:D-inositol-3-phosphate glycosyltransferase
VIVVPDLEGDNVMRIALVTGHAAPSPAGPAAAAPADPREQAVKVAALAGTLVRLGHQVTVYARKDSADRPRASSVAGVRFEYVPAGPEAPLGQDKLLPQLGAFSAGLAERWQQRPPDVVHAHFWTSGLAALAATRGTSIPVVQSFHSLGAADRRRQAVVCEDAAVRIRLERLIGRNVRKVVAASSAEVADLAGQGVPRTSIAVVPAGVDTSRFGPTGPVARRGKRPRLLAAAPEGTGHGLDTVIRALAAVPDAELLIVGGPPRDELGADPVLHQLARLAQRLQVTSRLLFTGQVSQARMPALLRSADLFVHLASYEPTEIQPLEAMACGTPVIAGAGGADEDAVVDGATGALIPRDDPAALARRIRQLLGSPMLLEGCGIAAADRARSRYSWERVGQETLAVYDGSRQQLAA